MNREELLKIMKFTQEQIALKEYLIKEIEENFPSDNIDAKNAVGMIILHLLTLRQKEKVEEYAISIVDRLETKEQRLQRAEELIRQLIEQKDFNAKTNLKFCRFCGRKLSKGHWIMCPVEKSESFLAEVEG